MTMKNYCGNLLWQSSLTLLAHDYIEALSLYGEVLGELGEGHVMNAKVKRALCFGFALCLVGCIKAKRLTIL